MMFYLLFAWLLLSETLNKGGDEPCNSARTALESQDSETFNLALQKVLDHECEELLPRVAELFSSGECPARFHAADVLALSGVKSYGLLLIRYYFEATAGIQDFNPGSLRDEVILACSDLPRGRNLHQVSKYVSSPPRLQEECLRSYRDLLEGHFEDRWVMTGALALIEHTTTPGMIDITERAYNSPDWNLRAGAVISLQNIQLDVSLPIFRRAIADPNGEVRYQAVRLLRERSDPRIRSLFGKRLPSETDERLVEMMKDYLKKSEGDEP